MYTAIQKYELPHEEQNELVLNALREGPKDLRDIWRHTGLSDMQIRRTINRIRFTAGMPIVPYDRSYRTYFISASVMDSVEYITTRLEPIVTNIRHDLIMMKKIEAEHGSSRSLARLTHYLEGAMLELESLLEEDYAKGVRS